MFFQENSRYPFLSIFDNAFSDVVGAIISIESTGNFLAEFVGMSGIVNRDWFSRAGLGSGIKGMGVHNYANLFKIPIEIEMVRSIYRLFEFPI